MTNRHGVQPLQGTTKRNEYLSNLTALPCRHDYFGLKGKDVEFYDINYPWFWQRVPSKEEVRLYSNLPLDIVRSIFDMAMWEHPKPVHLLLVSREVKNWIEPLLYQHLQFSEPRRLGQLYRTYLGWKKQQRLHHNSAERGYLSLRGTKSVIFCVHSGSATPMFGEMTALERVEFWHYGEPFIFHSSRRWGETSSTSTTNEVQEDTYRYQGIRHLSLNGAHLHYFATFCHRAFRDITHLDIYFHEDVAWETLCHLQSLTHFALGLVEHWPRLSAQELDSWASRIITACPLTVQALIICCIDAHNENFDLLDFIRSGSEPDSTDSGGTTRIPSSIASNPKDHHQIPLHNLQFLSRLALGQVDPRVVVGSAIELHDDHTFRNGVVYITYRDRLGPHFGHDGMRWDEAERIIKRRLL